MKKAIAVGVLLVVVVVLVRALLRSADTPDVRDRDREIVRVGVRAAEWKRRLLYLNLCISADGSVLAFESNMPDLVPGDTNATYDVFVHDVRTGQTEMVSVDPSGKAGNGKSTSPSISADGRFVAFLSQATNLVPGRTSRRFGVFLRDRETGVTERVASHFGRPSLSADGRFVAFSSGLIFVKDRQSGSLERPVVAGAKSQLSGQIPTISADGRFVAYTRLVPQGGVPPGETHRPRLFLYDRRTRTIEEIATDVLSGKGISLSADGRFVAFTSDAPDLVNKGPDGIGWDGFLYDRETKETQWMSTRPPAGPADCSGEAPSVSGDGRFVAFVAAVASPANGGAKRMPQVYVLDRETGRAAIVSASASGTPGNLSSLSSPRISADGRFVAFMSFASNLVPGDDKESADIIVVRNPHAP